MKSQMSEKPVLTRFSLLFYVETWSFFILRLLWGPQKLQNDGKTNFEQLLGVEWGLFKPTGSDTQPCTHRKR